MENIFHKHKVQTMKQVVNRINQRRREKNHKDQRSAEEKVWKELRDREIENNLWNYRDRWQIEIGRRGRFSTDFFYYFYHYLNFTVLC